MAMALLIIHNGTALINRVLNGTSEIREKKKAIKKESSRIGMKDPKIDFFINPTFDGCSFNSREPSSTIKINPIVPRMGNTGCRLGIGI